MNFGNEKEPIPWVKVHDLPDYVRYRHDKHINAENEVYPNGVPCQECHGPIETMDLVEKFDPSFGQMGWCLACHLKIPGAMERKHAVASTTDPTKLKDYQHPSGDYIRPNLSDCLTCHY